MKVLSPAKINLTLRVFGVRADGFHALDSMVMPVGLVDEVTLERSVETTLKISSESVDLSAMPVNVEQNLAVRAVRLLEAEVGRSLPTQLTIRKSIPLGGGLGGGSSNAAAVLRGMNTLWELGLSQERLCELGARLGSDVALFILDGLVRMQGRGEIVERLPMAGAPSQWVVLVNCGEHCSTPAVYRAFDAQSSLSKLLNVQTSTLTTGDGLCDNLRLFLRAGEVSRIADELVNDLEAPCFELFPRVAETARTLKALGCTGVRLCGSGATVFGLVSSREEGENALRQAALAGCWRACVQTLPDGVMAAHGPLTPIVMVRIHVGQP